jgi:hypothetical protein
MVSNKDADIASAKETLNRFTSGYEIVVPQAAIGEAATTIMKEYREDSKVLKRKLGDFADKLLNFLDAETCLPSVSPEILQHAQYLMQDCGVDPTDALITAHALSDPDSQMLITADRNLLGNYKVRTYEQSLRADGKRNVELWITDSP